MASNRTVQLLIVKSAKLIMVQLTTEQRVFIVVHYTQTENTTEVQNAFLARFPDRNPPHKSTILRNVRKYSRAGTSLNLNKGNSGRRRTARSAQNIAAVRNLLEENPHVSVRRNPVAISSAGFNRITRLDLRWHPYRMHVRHELLERDFPRRVRFAEWFVQRCRRDDFLRSIIIGDEATFSMNGEVNTQNVRQYSAKGNPPDFNFDRNVSRAKLTVWAALLGNGLIFGPYFFDRNVDGISYLRMFNEFVHPQLALHFGNQQWDDMFRGLWWAQDGAPAHRLIEVRDRLNRVFGDNHVIALGHNIEWPPRSPDLTPCDFFLWGYVKNRVFSTPPENVNVLRQRIIDTFDALKEQPEMITRAVQAMQSRATLCVERNGGHVEGHGP